MEMVNCKFGSVFLFCFVLPYSSKWVLKQQQPQQGTGLSNCQRKCREAVVQEVHTQQESHEEEKHSELPSQGDKNQMISLRLDPLTTTQTVAMELNVNHSVVIWRFEGNWKAETACEVGASWTDSTFPLKTVL